MRNRNRLRNTQISLIKKDIRSNHVCCLCATIPLRSHLLRSLGRTGVRYTAKPISDRVETGRQRHQARNLGGGWTSKLARFLERRFILGWQVIILHSVALIVRLNSLAACITGPENEFLDRISHAPFHVRKIRRACFDNSQILCPAPIVDRIRHDHLTVQIVILAKCIAVRVIFEIGIRIRFRPCQGYR